MQSMANTFPVTAKSVAGIDLLKTTSAKARSVVPFFVPTIYGGCHGGTSVRRFLVGGKVNPVAPATLLIDLNGGSSLTQHEDTTMSNPTIKGEIRPLISVYSKDEIDISYLPFVKIGKNVRNGARLWCVKASGDYSNDYLIGKYYALEYLQYSLISEIGFLALILSEMPRKQTGIEEGFLSTVEEYALLGSRDQTRRI